MTMELITPFAFLTDRGLNPRGASTESRETEQRGVSHTPTMRKQEIQWCKDVL